jgi:hypothetical protein
VQAPEAEGILRDSARTSENLSRFFPKCSLLKNFTSNINTLRLREPLLGSRLHLGFAQAGDFYCNLGIAPVPANSFKKLQIRMMPGINQMKPCQFGRISPTCAIE